MHKSITVLPILALAALGGQQGDPAPHSKLKEERMFVEYTASADEAVIVVEAESEDVLHRVQVRSPGGQPVLELRTRPGQAMGMAGFVVESVEVPLATLRGIYAEGSYELVAESTGGRSSVGRAELTFEIPPAPLIVYPTDGMVGVPTNLVVAWIPASQARGSEVTGSKIVVEQGEDDGLTATLPASSSSFQVPDGILSPGTPTLVEVAAMGRNGNRTLVEVSFMTW